MVGQKSALTKKLLMWYRHDRRDLPWRVAKTRQNLRGPLHPDPYHVFVSEAMLQQTQVATVIPYFHRFIERFPTFADLAAADEQEVLRLWQGLGYYSRARNLRLAAIDVMQRFGGQLPSDVERLQTLRGVGRYTAGAIASIAFGRREPILDGNVVRVLCRWDKIATDPRQKETVDLLWMRAAEILPQAKHMSDFNSALMELGATVCTPRNPQCLTCPVREHCEACAAGVQEQIPLAKKAKPTPLEKRWTFCIERDGKWLIEQRPAKGRWAGMWQFVTRENEEVIEGAKQVAKLGIIKHVLTHRRYRFDVRLCKMKSERSGTWVTLDELDKYPMSRPQLKIAEMLRELRGK